MKMTKDLINDILYGINPAEIQKNKYITEMYFDENFMNTVRKQFPLDNYTTKRFFRKNEIDYFRRCKDIEWYITRIAWMKSYVK